MTTWTFRGLAVGAVCAALAGCDASGGLNGAPGGAGAKVHALPFAVLARGPIALAPPDGFCIDKRSVRARFALLARCDTLGGQTSFDTPLAIITAATVDPDAAGLSAGLGLQGGTEQILNRRTYETMVVTQVRGAPPSPEMRDEFWRAMARVGDQMVGLAIYEPKGGSGLGERAPDMLRQMMRRTVERTASQTRPAQDNSATTEAKPATN